MGCGSSSEEATFVQPPKTVNGALRGRVVNEEVEHIELTESVVQEYIDLEKHIYRLEEKNVLKKYESKMLHADDVKTTVDQLEATYKELKKQTEKEKADVDNIEQPSVRAFLKQQGTWEQKFNKEQQEYLDSLNKQEVAEKELQGAKMQYSRASKIAEIYKKRSDRLNEFYDKQDHLLAGIFGGEYGSDLENKLEAELDDALDWQQRVSLAKFKWTNGRVLLVHACTQMAFGIKRWKELEAIELTEHGLAAESLVGQVQMDQWAGVARARLTQMAFGIKRWKELEAIELTNTRMRYFAGAEARNNFIAAGQNVQSCRVYLGKVRFPYCTVEEMERLETAVNNAFTDIQSNEKYAKSLEVYQMIHKKVASLIQWFDQVIKETILRDLEKANAAVSKIQKDLRAERLRLIKEKVRETLGRDLELEYDNVSDDDQDDEELLALEAERVKDGDDLPGERLTGLLSMSQPDGHMPSPVPTNELAPLPSDEDLFGNVAAMREQHDKQRLELEKQQRVAKAKVDVGLQEKLRQRRSRRDRRGSKQLGKPMRPQ